MHSQLFRRGKDVVVPVEQDLISGGDGVISWVDDGVPVVYAVQRPGAAIGERT